MKSAGAASLRTVAKKSISVVPVRLLEMSVE